MNSEDNDPYGIIKKNFVNGLKFKNDLEGW